MKRLFSTVTFLITVFAAFAQTPKEIINRMGEELNKHESDGIYMITDVKVPVVGTLSTKTYSRGEKLRMETQTMGIDVIIFEDEETTWTYNSKTNKVVIEKLSAGNKSESEGDMELFDNITDGYDVTLDKETGDAWYFSLKKQKTNKEKDAPKKIDLVVAKGTYLPKALSAKMSGLTVTMRDFAFGVSEKKVTFNAADFPGVVIEDKR